MPDETTLQALRALADPTRLHIVGFLSRTCCSTAEVDEEGAVYSPTAGQVCCHITGAAKITSTVSHHLHELEAAGLVTLERKGKTTVCRLKTERLEALASELAAIAKGSDVHVCC